MAGSRLIVALDFPTPEAALTFVRRLPPGSCRLKVGFELFVAGGPALVERLQALGFAVFLDLKFHDIPNTVAAACRAAQALGVWMLNVHASGGRRMMEAARAALEAGGGPRPRLVAVTVLTSLAGADLREVGLPADPAAQVRRLATLAKECGLDGVVCSGREAAGLRAALGPDFLLVTPGIRPPGTPTDDQRRTMQPAEARVAGSDYLVVGRPVTHADAPVAVISEIRIALGEAPIR